MEITERLLLLITAIIAASAAFFCMISLATPRWSFLSGLYCKGCPTAPAGLSIVALIFLIALVLVLILIILKILPKSIRFVCFLIIFLATVFTLAAHASYFDMVTGYSYKLMVFAHFLCYIASILTAFWLGGSYAATVVIVPNNP